MFGATEDVNLILILSNSWPACPELGSGLVLCLLWASCPDPRGGWLAIPSSLKSKGRMMLSTQNDSVAINQSRKPLAQRDIMMEPIWLGDLIPVLCRVGSPYLGPWFLCDQNKPWADSESYSCDWNQLGLSEHFSSSSWGWSMALQARRLMSGLLHSATLGKG